MNGANESKWVWTGDDQGLIKILKEIDKFIVKTESDSKAMEDSMTKAMKGSARSVDYLKNKMNSLRQMRDQAFDERKISRFNSEIRKTEFEIRRLENLGKSKGGFFGNSFASTGLGSQLMGFMGNPYTMSGAAAAAGSAFIANSVSYGRNMSTQMAKINATAQMSPEKLIALRNSFFPIANQLSLDVNTLPAAYEALISATGNKAEADRLLTPSLKLAKAGFTDPSVTGRALSQIKMTPGVNMSETQIADMLMAAKNYGRGELSDFANYLPGLISTGKLRGFSEEDVVGSYSYLSRSNSAEQSAMLMSNFMNVVLRKDVTDKIRDKINVDVFAKNGGLRDMSDIIGDIAKAMNGLSDKGKQSFLDSIKVVDQQAFQAFGALTANANELNKAITAVGNSAGVLDKTVKASEDANTELIKFYNNIDQVKMSLSGLILPGVNAGLSVINKGTWKDVVSVLTNPLAWVAQKTVENQFGEYFVSDEQKKKNQSDLNSKNFAYGTNYAKGILQKYSNMGIDDQVAATMDDIREQLFGRGIKTSSTANAALKSYLYKLAAKPAGTTTTPEALLQNEASASPDQVMKEHRQVRNVTVNIDQLLKLDNVTVASGKDLTDLTSEDVLNAFIKVVRDAEQSLETR